MCDDFPALLQRRKISEAKRIENELNAKNQAEGKTERVEVDVESVDWLYGTYKLKGEKTEEGESNGGETEAKVKTKETVIAKSEKLTPAEVDALPVISKSDPRDNDSSIFSTSSSKIDDIIGCCLLFLLPFWWKCTEFSLNTLSYMTVCN